MKRAPFDTCFGALAQRGCSPREVGPRRVVAHCPVPDHNDRLPSLSLGEGDGGRALLRCFAGCQTADVVDALGLEWRDLFADEPERSRVIRAPRRRQPRVVTEDMLDSVVVVLGAANIATQATANPSLIVAARCPACGAGALWLHQDRGRVRASCWTGGCSSEAILDALEARVTGGDRVAA